VRVRIGMDRMTNRPRGFAFAEFSDEAKAADAIRRFDSYELRGRRLRVNDAEQKPPPRAPRPPMGAGGPRPGGPSRPGGGFSSPPPWAAPSGGAGFAPPEAGGDWGGGGPPNKKGGGSRRGLRARKRSLRW
jgi:hypothetical protein